ncbi:BlaI/MecI/CopY family transcriptional regulator [Rhodocaloribacter litoris]|uniref:BlaI/MecI/CopY family transcriptional regulator n=1 Tax=Rhodocaloribacter litoris TaxID=2558931 RepID=UPI001E2CC67F|nr:BlaI/MecI/CopY family transcriptional regulator [Rhodocaloribacter litoris]
MAFDSLMRRKKSLIPLGETEMEVLQHVWSLGRATVAEVHARLLKERRVAYTTVMTVMKNLADKGYLGFDREGNTYVYHPARSPEEVRHSLLKGLLQKVFRGSPSALVQTLVRHEPLSEAERAALLRLIESIEDDDGDTA